MLNQSFFLFAIVAFVILSFASATTKKEKDCWCWEQTFTTNTTFVNTLNAGFVQMGYLSQINNAKWPVITASGQPVITPTLLQQKCDALGKDICAAVQFYKCPGLVLNGLKQDWGNFLTPEEFSLNQATGAKITSTEVTGFAYKRVAYCKTKPNCYCSK